MSFARTASTAAVAGVMTLTAVIALGEGRGVVDADVVSQSVPADSALTDSEPTDNVPSNTAPNIVFVMLDDVSTGYMDAMPVVSSEIGAKGVEFAHGIIPTSLCCPSRASTLTGDLAHTTGVYTNVKANGAWETFRSSEDDTIAVRLQDAGYRTGLFGKYMNNFRRAPRDYVPPGWDEFQAFRRSGYYDWTISGSVFERYGDDPVEDYSTDVLADKAVEFVEGHDDLGDRVPFFLYFSPKAAHGPMIPAPRHAGTWYDEPLDLAFDEADMSDKPRFMQRKPRRGNAEKFVRVQRTQHEMLMSVDEGVARIIEAIGPEEVANTLFIVMADNGYLLGSHRLTLKNFPYARSASVPMMIRWDGHIDPSIADRLTTNTDLTATMADAAGVSWPMDGIPVWEDRTGTVLEQTQHKAPPARNWHPGYCGYRTADWLYVKWNQHTREELYRYSTDPGELNNLAIKPRWEEKRKEMRRLARRACRPVPPGFSWKNVAASSRPA